MGEQSYFQLIGPLIFLIFSTGFLAIWLYARDLRAAGLFALSYGVGCVAFVADFSRPLMNEFVASYVTNIPYTISAALLIVGIFTLYKTQVPWKLISFIVGGTLISLIWFRHFDDDIGSRTVVMSLMAALMFSIASKVLFVARLRLIDRLLVSVTAVISLQFIARALWVALVVGDQLTATNYPDSSVALAFHFVASIGALCIAGTLFMIFGMMIVERLRSESFTDHLTGLLNRRGVDAQIPIFEKALNEGMKSHGVVVIDIDHFKSVNDTYGHDVGDKVLTCCADMLARLQTGNSIVARMGGEEFCLILFNANAGVANLAAEYARSIISTIEHEDMEDRSVTISLGVALWDSETNFADALREADRALYEAKSTGRNRVCLADGCAEKLSDPVNKDQTKALSA